MKFFGVLITIILTVVSFSSCLKKTEVSWSLTLPKIGSQSSIRTVDLNGDDVLDIVMGAGENEYVASTQGVLAIDGQTGKLLWQQQSRDLVFGSASFVDINGDKTPDVIIGGRSCTLMALNGKDGKLIWGYNADKYTDHPVWKKAHLNFYSSALVPDQNGDGIMDIVTQNGGNPTIGPRVWEGRVAGVLLLIDSKSGEIIAGDTMPDGMESYMSPVAFQQKGDQEMSIIFGSGGETFGGHLYLAKVSDLKEQKLNRAKIIAAEKEHGFIAPPVVVDINGDAALDIITISHASTAYAIDGKTLETIWKQTIEGAECSNSFAVGYFSPDETPDFFTFVSLGEWPNNTGLRQVLIDGKDGNILYENNLGCTGFSSPVAYDLNGDGQEEAIISINEFDCSTGFSGDIQEITTRLLVINFANKSEYPVDMKARFKNIFTTPWIGDLDNDGYLDMVHAMYYHTPPYIVSFLGMEVKRISTHLRVKKPVKWGAYMGSRGDAVFE